MTLRHIVCSCAAFIVLLVNPLILQGCFLRCPEVKPRSYETQQKFYKNSMEQTITFIRDDGVLELELLDVSFSPDYARERYSSLAWISEAHAMPSCQVYEASPSNYILRASLTMTWIPEQGEAVALVESLPLIADLSGGSINQSFVQMRGMDDASDWSLLLQNTSTPEGSKYRLMSSLLRPEVDGERWLIETSEDEVVSFDTGSEAN